VSDLNAGAPIGQRAEKQRVSELNEKRGGSARNSVIEHAPPTNNPIGRIDGSRETAPPRHLSSRLRGKESLKQSQRSSARLRQLATAHFVSSLDGYSGDALRVVSTTIPAFVCPVAPPGFENLTVDEDSERFRLLLKEIDRLEHHATSKTWDQTRNDRDDDESSQPSCLLVTVPIAASDLDIRSQPMPKMVLPPVFPTRPLNLNSDGTPINYRKSHSGPHAEYWAQADGEEIERLFVTGIIKPESFGDIPRD
jgi:hypothetical protein